MPSNRGLSSEDSNNGERLLGAVLRPPSLEGGIAVRRRRRRERAFTSIVNCQSLSPVKRESFTTKLSRGDRE